jgi:serine/threonine protein phosphatase PrpC/CRP-like cAMP-binding protein
MDVRFWAQTDVGRQRDHNEDSFLVDKKLNLFICCDGMGGHAAGEVASSAAVHEGRKFLTENREILEKYSSDHAMVDRRDILTLIEHSVHHACARVHQLAQIDVRRKGMGTTMDAFLVAGNRGFIAHVGDARVFLLRQGQVHQLTEDHSLINELVRRGKLKPGQEVALPYKNAVTRAVGVYLSVEVDTLDFDLLPGDRYLMCTDGLHGYTDDQPEQILKVLSENDLQSIPQAFIDFANSRGGKDNITCVVVEVGEEVEAKEEVRTAEVKLKLDTLRAIPIFKYLTYKELVKLLNVTTTAGFAPGEIIMEEGTDGDSFFVTLEGSLRVDKGDTEVATLDKGSHFGEMALVDRSPRSATVTVLSDTRVLRIQRDAFYDLLRKDSQLAVKLLWSFVQVLTIRLRQSTTDLAARSELELIDEMEPLFKAVGDATSPSSVSVPSLEDPVPPGEELQMLEEHEILALEEDEDVLSTKDMYQALKLAARPTGVGTPPPPPPEAVEDSGEQRQETRPLRPATATPGGTGPGVTAPLADTVRLDPEGDGDDEGGAAGG